MLKEHCVAYIMRTIWEDLGVAMHPGYEEVFILKMLSAIECVEKEAQREVREALRNQITLN